MSTESQTSQPAHGQDKLAPGKHWWAGINRYQWIVLIIASAGWVFDVFEGQIFNLTRVQMLHELLGDNATPGEINRWGDIFLGVFLIGGTIGGIFFGWLGDRWGRRPTMIVTILMYSVFSSLTYFANDLPTVGILRFLVAMGVGGEWAVAAALVAETFPAHARAHASGIFHTTSVFGVWLAAAVGIAVGPDWRLAYLFGLLPALLILWVRTTVKEPESWQAAKQEGEDGKAVGSFRELLLDPRWARRAWLGTMMAGVGLGVFWAVTVAGQDLAREFLLRTGATYEEAVERSKFAFGVIQAIGSGLGLLAFGPICVKFGRKKAFIIFQAASLVVIPVTCFLPTSYGMLLAMLPLFGFCTIAVQAGFAIYFPELFPSRLRSTGTGFCFNAGRLLAAGLMIFSGWVKAIEGIDLRTALTILGCFFVIGIVVVLFLPETKDQPLPE